VFHDAQQDVLVNPTLIVEVLSPSTEAYDRGEKFLRYQELVQPGGKKTPCCVRPD